MFETAAVALSLALLVAGPLSVVAGLRVYSAEQRATAHRLWTWYVVGVLLEGAVGLCSLYWLLTRGLPSVWHVPALAAVPLPVLLVQWRMHERMDYVGWASEWIANRGP